MKSILILILFFYLNNSIFALSDWESGKRMKEAIASILLIYEMAKDTDDGRLLNDYGVTSINGAYLRINEKSFIQTTLYRGSKYLFMAGGDSKIYDVDIIIKNEYKTIIERDIGHEKFAFIFFEPPITGSYIIELSTPGVSASGFGVIAFLERGSYSNINDIVDAIENMEERWNHWNRKYETRFASDPEALEGSEEYRSFCFNGQYLSQGDTYGYNGNGMKPNKDYIMLAAGDNNSVDIDLSVIYGETQKSDSLDDVIPIIFFNSSYSKEYSFTVKNYKSSRRSFIITCTLEIL